MSLKKFREYCEETFGCQPEYITYLLEEMRIRMGTFEDTVSSTMPLVGGAVAKMEGLSSILIENSVIDARDLNRRMESLVGDLNKKNLIG
jgi:hypothetical protein